MSDGDLSAAVGAREPELAPVICRLRQLDVVIVREDPRTFTLAPSGRDVSVGWLVRQLEGMGDVVECGGSSPCPLVCGCRLRSALRDAQQAFFSSLDSIAVRDVVPGETRSSLGMPTIGVR